jgi:hypothetical protein
MLLDSHQLAESARRRKLHSQIGALESKLSRMPYPATEWERQKHFRLYNKIRRLKARLGQLELPFA